MMLGARVSPSLFGFQFLVSGLDLLLVIMDTYQGILHVLLNEAILSTLIVLSIPSLAFGRCQCTSMFYDTISRLS